MQHYERSYSTARSVFTLLEFVGWAVVAVGVTASILGGGSIGDAYGRSPPFEVLMLALLPGIGIAFGGLVSIALVQSSRANIDTAEMTRDMLFLMRNGTVTSPSTVSTPEISNGLELASTKSPRESFIHKNEPRRY